MTSEQRRGVGRDPRGSGRIHVPPRAGRPGVPPEPLVQGSRMGLVMETSDRQSVCRGQPVRGMVGC